jgi:dephospho-CoA kinase
VSVLRVGLTGGIGSGKSEVSRRLAERGAAVLDADKAAREVVEPGTPGLARIAEVFGDEVLRSDGSLDREKLGAIVFADEARRTQLNSIVHPLVRDVMLEKHEQAERSGVAVLVEDVPLLAENGMAPLYDLVIVVDAPEEVQLDRLVRLRGMPAEQARARMAAQSSRQDRLAIADIVIRNETDLADLDREVDRVWRELQAAVTDG